MADQDRDPLAEATTDVAASAPQLALRKRSRPPSRKGKGPTPSSWKPGQSGNPAGRPRVGLAFAERVRERVDPDMVIELAMRVARDETLSPQERLTALWPLIDRGYVKPPAGLELAVSSTTADAAKWDDVPIEKLRAAAEQLKALRDSGSESQQGTSKPSVTDDNANSSHRLVTDSEHP